MHTTDLQKADFTVGMTLNFFAFQPHTSYIGFKTG